MQGWQELGFCRVSGRGSRRRLFVNLRAKQLQQTVRERRRFQDGFEEQQAIARLCMASEGKQRFTEFGVAAKAFRAANEP